MILYGTAHRVGDNVTTGQIIAPEQRADDPAILAAHCLAALDPAIAERVAAGDVLLAGQGFGAGDDPDTAVLALQAVGFGAVVCATADTSFVEAAATYGLPVLLAPDAARQIAAGALVRLDLERGRVTDRSTGADYRFRPCPPELVAAVRRATLLERMRRVVEEEGFDG